MKLSSNALSAVVTLSVASLASAENFGFAGQVYDQKQFQQFESMSVGDRILDVTKNAWPECMDGALNNAENCKTHIDTDLAGMNLDIPIETVIVYSRTPESPTAHAMVIPLDGDSMCVGKHGDGMLYYDFDWCVTKKEKEVDEVKLAESRKLIQPSKWTKMIAANKNVDCIDIDGDGDMEVWHSKAYKTMGGNFEVACSSEEGVTKMKEAKSNGAIVDVGCNKIPPINCSGEYRYCTCDVIFVSVMINKYDFFSMLHHSLHLLCVYPKITGMSGVDACKMIKEDLIPYPNKDGKNMECWLSYLPNSPKLAEMEAELIAIDEPPVTKVVIYAQYETKKVSAPPLMAGPRSVIGSE